MCSYCMSKWKSNSLTSEVVLKRKWHQTRQGKHFQGGNIKVKSKVLKNGQFYPGLQRTGLIKLSELTRNVDVLIYWKKNKQTLLHSVTDSQGFPTTRRPLGWWVIFSNKSGNDIKCLMPRICAGTLFLMLLKFGAVLSIIWGFLVAVYAWTHLLQCIVVLQSFLRMLKLRKLDKLYLSRGGPTLCHGVLEHGLNLHRNIPLRGDATDEE